MENSPVFFFFISHLEESENVTRLSRTVAYMRAYGHLRESILISFRPALAG